MLLILYRCSQPYNFMTGRNPTLNCKCSGTVIAVLYSEYLHILLLPVKKRQEKGKPNEEIYSRGHMAKTTYHRSDVLNAIMNRSSERIV